MFGWDQIDEDQVKEIAKQIQYKENSRFSYDFDMNINSQNSNQNENSLDQKYIGMKGLQGELNEQSPSLSETDLRSENFDCKKYIILTYKNHDFEALQDVKNRLRKVINNDTIALQKLVEEHSERFVATKDGMDELQSYFNNPDLLATQGITKFEARYKKLNSQLQNEFKPIFERKQQTDQMKSALSTVNSYNFLFSLPQQIKEDIRDLRFDQVVRAFRRAREFDYLKQTRIFRKILLQVEREINAFRMKLFKQLENPSTSLKEQEKVVSYLFELGSKKDPVNFYMNQLHLKTKQQLMKNEHDFISKLERYEEKNQYKIPRKTLINNENNNNTTKNSNNNDDEKKKGNEKNQKIDLESTNTDYEQETQDFLEEDEPEEDPQINGLYQKYINKITALIEEQIPKLWLFASSHAENKTGNKAENNVLVVASKLLDDVLEKFAIQIRELFFPKNADQMMIFKKIFQLRFALRESIITLKRALRKVKQASIPGRTGMIFSNLVEELVSKFVASLSEFNIFQCSRLYYRETWERDQTHIKAQDMFVTNLPRIFHQKVSHLLDDIKGVIDGNNDDSVDQLGEAVIEMCYGFIDSMHALSMRSKQRSMDLVNTEKTDNDPVNSIEMESLIQENRKPLSIENETNIYALPFFKIPFELLAGFEYGKLSTLSKSLTPLVSFYSENESLPQLAIGDESKNILSRESTSSLGAEIQEKDTDSQSLMRTNTGDSNKQLLILISNLKYSKDVVFPAISQEINSMFRIQNSFERGFSAVSKLATYLESEIKSRYTAQKTKIINRICKKGILFSGFDPAHFPSPSNIRSYVMELLHELVVVHSEIMSVTQKEEFVSRIMKKLLFNIFLIISECIQEFDELSHNASHQILLETEFISQTLQIYSSEKVTQKISEIRSVVRRFNYIYQQNPHSTKNKNHTNIEDLLQKIHQRTSLQFECFQK